MAVVVLHVLSMVIFQAKQQGQTDNAREYLKQALAFNKLIGRLLKTAPTCIRFDQSFQWLILQLLIVEIFFCLIIVKYE